MRHPCGGSVFVFQKSRLPPRPFEAPVLRRPGFLAVHPNCSRRDSFQSSAQHRGRNESYSQPKKNSSWCSGIGSPVGPNHGSSTHARLPQAGNASAHSSTQTRPRIQRKPPGGSFFQRRPAVQGIDTRLQYRLVCDWSNSLRDVGALLHGVDARKLALPVATASILNPPGRSPGERQQPDQDGVSISQWPWVSASSLTQSACSD